jgi:hypothetical protein
MLQMRARGFALRDKFSDVLKGLALREEIEDYQPFSVVEKSSAGEAKIKELINEKSKSLSIEAPIDDRIKIMIEKFSKIGITQSELESHLGHELLTVTSEEIKQLQEFYKLMKEENKDDKKQGT